MAVDPYKIKRPANGEFRSVREQEATAVAEENNGDLQADSVISSQLGAAKPAMIQDMALRASGSSAMGGIMATEQYEQEIDTSTIGGTVRAVPALLDKIWMNDWGKGPIARDQELTVDPLSLYQASPLTSPIAIALKSLGFETQVDIPKAVPNAAATVWEHTLGNIGEGAGVALGAIIEGLEWTAATAGYGFSYTPFYNTDVVERPSWDTAHRIGWGDIWTLGTQTQTGNFSEYVAQQKRDYEAQQRLLENKDAMEITGLALKDAFSGKQPVDVWATEGISTNLAGAPIFVEEGFDPNDPEQMRALAEGAQGGRFNFTSELADFAGEWYLGAAPFKAVKLVRSGSETLGLSGITSRNTGMGRVNAKMEQETDDFIEYVTSGGERGKITSMGADAEALAAGSREEILRMDWVRPKRAAGGTEAEVIAGVGAEITDPVLAATFRAAMSGSAKYQQKLVNDYGLIADAIARQRNLTVKMGSSEELLWIQKPSGVIVNPVLRQNLDGLPDAALVEDALRMSDELGILDKAGFAVTEAGMQGVRTAGMNTVWGKRLANAWRAGSAHRQQNTLINKAKGGTSAEGSSSWGDRVTRLHSEGSAVEEWTFQISSHFRPVGILNWVNTEKQAGWIVVRGTDDTDALAEWKAAFGGSKTLVRDQEFQSRMMRIWGRAQTEEQKMRAVEYIERAVVNRLAKEFGVDVDMAVDVYKAVYSMRDHTLQTLKRQKGKDVGYGYDPETGKLLLSSPMLASQLESRVPLLDFGLMEKTIRRMAGRTYGAIFKAEAGGKASMVRAPGGAAHAAKMFLDELNSLWKLNTLLRLGYTQRNLTEGWMRSLAYLGTIPNATPEKISRGVGRLFTNTYRAGQRQKIWQQEKAVGEIVEGTQEIAAKYTDDIARLDKQILNNPSNRELRMQRQWHQQQLAKIQDELDFQREYLTLLREKRLKNQHRRMLEEDGEAFGDIHGDLRRITSGADVNVQTLLQSEAARRATTTIGEAPYAIIQPGAANYYEEMVKAGAQFTGDKLARMALAGKSPAEMSAWLATPSGRAYLKRLGIASDRASAMHHAERVHRVVNNYLPTDQAKSLFTGKKLPTPEEVQNSLANAPKSPIHGQEITLAAGETIFTESVKGANKARTALFEWLGSKPESYLVRHPFYAEVYARRRAELRILAKEQGRTFDDELIESIEKASHRTAQKATTDVMFTISRYSNPASMMRFLSPFFSAWENSMRTWGTLIARDPSTLMRGSWLWNEVNQVGTVMTYDGKVIPQDKWGFLTGDEQDGMIMLPEAWTKPLEDKLGGFVPAIPKGGLNVITPGDTPYLPGFGPAGIVPVQLLLANKPDLQVTLHRALGDKLYRQIAPFGRIKEFEWNQLLSSGQRKGYFSAMGDQSEDFIKVSDGVARNMLTDWYQSGADPSTKPTASDFLAQANNWYQFNALANYTLPFAVTRVSKFRTELNAWRTMSRMMPYDQAMARFEEMYPGAVPLTISSLERNTKGLRSDMPSFRAVDNNLDIVEKYSNRAAGRSFSAAGILAAASLKGEFSPPAYDYFSKAKDPYSGDRYFQTMMPGEFADEANLRVAWIELNKVKADVEMAVEAGVLTKSDARTKLKEYALNSEAGGMAHPDRFGSEWAQAYQSFVSTTAAELGTVARIASDEDFAKRPDGQTQTWSLIRDYFQVRQDAKFARDNAANEDEKRMILEKFEEWSLDFRNSSLAFSDFYDYFLDGDDLSVKVDYAWEGAN